MLVSETAPDSVSGLHCITGLVLLDATERVGVITGRVFPRLGDGIPVRQVVGPAGGPVPLTEVDGENATVCGRFAVQDGEVVLDVRRVIPRQRGMSPLVLVVALILLLALRN